MAGCGRFISRKASLIGYSPGTEAWGHQSNVCLQCHRTKVMPTTHQTPRARRSFNPHGSGPQTCPRSALCANILGFHVCQFVFQLICRRSRLALSIDAILDHDKARSTCRLFPITALQKRVKLSRNYACQVKVISLPVFWNGTQHMPIHDLKLLEGLAGTPLCREAAER